MCLVSFSKTPRYASLEKLDRFAGSPRWAYVVVTERCSHHCPWCYGDFGDGDEMSLSSFEAILSTLRQMDVRQITLSGGEPTEHSAFPDLLDRAADFHLHVASHGEHIDEQLATNMQKAGVRQVQINFQGSRHHHAIHGQDSFERNIRAIGYLLERQIEVVAMVTVGKYNLDDVQAIFEEAASTGVTRIRVWETTGRGTRYLRDVDAKTIFERCEKVASRIGYTHSLSYDPVYRGDISVPCLQLSGLYLYIDTQGRLRFCGAVEGGPIIAHMIDDTPEQILESYRRTNSRYLENGAPRCPARCPEPIRQVRA